MYYKKLYKEKLLAGDSTVIEDEMMPTIKCLSGPVDISINFMRHDGIKSRTVSLNIFDHMDIKIYHGWMVSSEDVPISEIVGSSFHDVIKVDSSDPSTLIQNAGEDSKKFFAGPELTTLGLQLLKGSLENDSVCVFFWKRSFHTMVKLNDELYVLQNDLNFLETDTVWKELKNVRDDGRFCTSSFQLIKHNCRSVKCQLKFISMMNLKRHSQAHLKRSSDNIALQKKDDIGKFWDQLNVEESLKILSLRDNQIKDLDSSYLIHILPTNSEDPLTEKLLGIINDRRKKAWHEIFSILNEASEGTIFSFDPLSDYNIGLTWADILCDSTNILPCYSYVMERIMVTKWIDYQTKEASKIGELILQQDKVKSCSKRKGKRTAGSDETAGDSSKEDEASKIGELLLQQEKVKSCSKRKGKRAAGSDETAGDLSKEDDVSKLSEKESVGDVPVPDFSSQIVHEYEEHSEDANATTDKLQSEKHGASKISEEESVGEIPKSHFSSEIEHEHQEHRISFEDYVEVTKLTKVYTLKPKKFFRIFKKAVKVIEKSRMGLSNVAARKALVFVLSLNLMTCAGRLCSRGFSHILF